MHANCRCGTFAYIFHRHRSAFNCVGGENISLFYWCALALGAANITCLAGEKFCELRTPLAETYKSLFRICLSGTMPLLLPVCRNGSQQCERHHDKLVASETCAEVPWLQTGLGRGSPALLHPSNKVRFCLWEDSRLKQQSDFIMNQVDFEPCCPRYGVKTRRTEYFSSVMVLTGSTVEILFPSRWAFFTSYSCEPYVVSTMKAAVSSYWMTVITSCVTLGFILRPVKVKHADKEHLCQLQTSDSVMAATRKTWTDRWGLMPLMGWFCNDIPRMEVHFFCLELIFLVLYPNNADDC